MEKTQYSADRWLSFKCLIRQRIKPSIPNIQPKSQAWDSRSLVWWLYSIWELVAYWMLRSGRIKGKTLVRLLCFAISCRVSWLGISSEMDDQADA